MICFGILLYLSSVCHFERQTLVFAECFQIRQSFVRAGGAKDHGPDGGGILRYVENHGLAPVHYLIATGAEHRLPCCILQQVSGHGSLHWGHDGIDLCVWHRGGVLWVRIQGRQGLPFPRLGSDLASADLFLCMHHMSPAP